MRTVLKLDEPEVLVENAHVWNEDYEADPRSATRRYRYRHPDIKAVLKSETCNKCVYCESKIGHNTPGDVEHKIPSSCRRDLHFAWSNLTIACTECNRRKLDYYDLERPFLDPYNTGIEHRIIHLGPILAWHPGDDEGEVSLRILGLSDASRRELLVRKTEAIDALNNLVARLQTAASPLKEVLQIRLAQIRSPQSEYSGMIDSICRTYAIE